MAKRKKKLDDIVPVEEASYDGLLAGVSRLLDHAHISTTRAVNGLMTATYFELGRRIVEFEQGGKHRAEYGEGLLKRLGTDLSKRFGRGFSRRNLEQMRVFYMDWEISQTRSGLIQFRSKAKGVTKAQTPSALLSGSQTSNEDSDVVATKAQTPSALSSPVITNATFPLPWSHYVRLMTVSNRAARQFYEEEAIKGGWSVRQLDRQISTQFYQRLSGSRRKAELRAKAKIAQPGDISDASDLVRDPYVLEFLNLRDEYGENDLEEAITRNLESFLVELGRGFTFIARQRKIRIDAQWYKIDLLLFHRRLRCLVIIDLKIGAFTHADAGQMNLYLNYAKEHLSEPGEHDPVGLILCSEKSDTVVKYAMGGINAKVFASEYLTVLPSVDELRKAIERAKRTL